MNGMIKHIFLIWLESCKNWKKVQWICNESSIYVRVCKGCQNKEQGGIFWTGSIGGSHGSHKKMETTG